MGLVWCFGSDLRSSFRLRGQIRAGAGSRRSSQRPWVRASFEVVRGLTKNPALPAPSQEDPGRGFVARWQAALERRRGRLESQGVIDRSALAASAESERGPLLQALEREVEGRMKLRLAARLEATSRDCHASPRSGFRSTHPRS